MSETVTITKEQWDRKWLGFEYDPKKYSDIYTNTSWDNLCKIGTVHEEPELSQEADYKYMGNEKLLAQFQFSSSNTSYTAYKELKHRLQAYKVPEKPLSEVELLDKYLQLEQDANGSPIAKATLRLKILDKMGAIESMNKGLKLPDTGDDEKKALDNFKGICKDFVEMERLNPIKSDTDI